MTPRLRAGRRHAGFSLVELMIMLVIELLVMGAAVAVYLKVQDTYRTTDSLGRLQEGARHAMSLVEADVRMASFWGLHNQPELNAISALSTFPANCGTDWVTDTANFISGENNGYSLPCAASGGGAQPDSDVLIVRRASAQRLSPQAASVAAASRDRVLIVSNPLAGEIFVPKDIGDSIPAGYATADPANAPPAADTRALLVNAYYVSRDSSVSTGYPALRRKRLSAGPSITDEELLPGVEDLQFEIGVDTTGDANVDAFVTAGDVPAGGTPVSVRLWLRLRAQDGDRQLLVHKTVQLRNARR